MFNVKLSKCEIDIFHRFVSLNHNELWDILSCNNLFVSIIMSVNIRAYSRHSEIL